LTGFFRALLEMDMVVYMLYAEAVVAVAA
jgi:hypothetical protein